MEWENDDLQSDEKKSEESNRRSKNPLREKKEKKHKKEKKEKKHKKKKRDEKERMDRGADGNPPSSSEKEVNGNIDNLSPIAYCSCVCDNNGEKMYVCRLCQIPTDKSSDDDDVDNQKAAIEIGIQQQGQKKNKEEGDEKIREGFEKLIHFIKSLE